MEASRVACYFDYSRSLVNISQPLLSSVSYSNLVYTQQ